MNKEFTKFLVLEGIDGSGTTTQLSRIAERLHDRGHVVCETREPSNGRIGKLIRELLAVNQDEERTVDAYCLGLLFAADRLEHLNREIRPAISRDEIVLCDRYLLSSLAYQSLGCDAEWVRSINQEALWPDITFVFDLPVELAVSRVSARHKIEHDPDEIFDGAEIQRRIAENYRREMEMRFEDERIIEIDASKSIDAVTESIMAHLINAGL